MFKVKFTCKKCGKVITVKSGVTEGICPYCGRVYYTKDIEDGVGTASISEKMDSLYNGKNDSLRGRQTGEDNTISSDEFNRQPGRRIVHTLPDAELRTLGRDGKPQKGRNNKLGERWGVCTGIAGALMALVLACTGIKSSDHMNSNTSTVSIPDYSTSILSEDIQDTINNLDLIGVTGSSSTLDVEDEMMQSALALMFDKDYEEVTLEDVASILYFGVYYEEGNDGMRTYHMEYSTADYRDYEDYNDFNYTVDTIDFEESSYIFDEFSVSCFPNLNKLALYGEMGFRMKDVPNLISITVDSMDMGELFYICDTDQIEEINIYSNIDNLDDIVYFDHLKSLSINASMLEDLSPIQELSELEKLHIYYASIVEDFSALESLTNLKTLQLDAPLLKNLNFLSSLPNLESLILQETEIDYC